jgi:hypothetical protein
VDEMIKFYHQYLDTHDEGPYSVSDMTLPEMVCFLSLILKLKHELSDSMKKITLEQFHTYMYIMVLTNIIPCILEVGTDVYEECTAFLFKVEVRKVGKVEGYIEVRGKEMNYGL